MTMKKLNLLSLLFIASTIVGCHNTTTKNTTTDAGSSNEETQEAVETNKETSSGVAIPDKFIYRLPS